MARTFNLADLFEIVADALADCEVMVTSTRRLTYADLDERANRLAHALLDRGIGPGQHVGLQLTNDTEYLEGMLACFKLRAVPVNVNYRYVEGELKYLFGDADLVALIVHRQFVGRVAAVLGPDLPTLKTVIVVEDESGATESIAGEERYEDLLAKASPSRDGLPEGRSDDDLYVVYTGGTTGMPKGVLWRHHDIFCGAMGGGDPFQSGNVVQTPDELGQRVSGASGLVAMPTPPFMHASAHWGAFHTIFTGGKIVLPPGGRFDPAAIWPLVEAEKINMMVIVGDAMARPLAEELATRRATAGDDVDTSSLIVIGSGGAILSAAIKSNLTELLPATMIVDGYGSSETGTLGNADVGASGPRFRLNAQTGVLDDDGKQVEAGSGQTGRLARKGFIPLGYYGDEEKTAKTFFTYDGVRWVLPGDMAQVEEDGTITLLGRGSVSINSGGEKIFPEEVESACKAHPSVFDAVVVGVPDERWGERVVAVVQARPGQQVVLDELQATCRSHIAGYKVPREIVVVGAITRSPAGKADYKWAKSVALEGSN